MVRQLLADFYWKNLNHVQDITVFATFCCSENILMHTNRDKEEVKAEHSLTQAESIKPQSRQKTSAQSDARKFWFVRTKLSMCFWKIFSFPHFCTAYFFYLHDYIQAFQYTVFIAMNKVIVKQFITTIIRLKKPVYTKHDS